MVDFIDQHKDEFGIEPTCRELQFAQSTYYAAKNRTPPARAMREAVLMPLLLTLWVANYRVYGARKLWRAAQRSGEDIGRDQVAPLMRQLVTQGVNRKQEGPNDSTPRGRSPTSGSHRPLVLADRPNALW